MGNKIKKYINPADSVKTYAKPAINSTKQLSTQTKPLVSNTEDNIPATSLFQGHLLKVKDPGTKIHLTKYDHWPTGILVAMFILFVWMYAFNRKKLNQVIKGFYLSRSNNNQMSREEFSIGNRVSFFLSIFFVVALTMFINKVIAYYRLQLFTDNLTALGIIIAFTIIIAYGIKLATIRLLGHIFQVSRIATDYMMTIFLFCNALGLFLLPVVICLTFVKQISPSIFIYAGLGIIVIFIMVRIFRGIFIGLKSSEISKFYLFMYLCTLEILPFLILAKLFMLNV